MADVENSFIVLASGSRYRRELLERLGLAFESWSPDIDESARPGEAPEATAGRLAREKALAAAERWSDAWVIGSDQVVDVDGRAVSKPGTLENARRQLRELSGRTLLFHTALCVMHAARRRMHERMVATEVRFRDLSHGEIDRYLEREAALDCAGSAKSEGLGISLLSRLRGDDPTALIGLPLIALAEVLRGEGFRVP